MKAPRRVPHPAGHKLRADTRKIQVASYDLFPARPGSEQDRLEVLPITCRWMPAVFDLTKQNLDMFRFLNGEVVHNGARVPGTRWLQHENPGLFVCLGRVLETAGHHERLTLTQVHVSFMEPDRNRSFEDKEHFILIRVMVPGEFALEFGQLEFLSIERCRNLGLPWIGDLGKLLGKIDLLQFLHQGSSF
jgi:hypothetical protein